MVGSGMGVTVDDTVDVTEGCDMGDALMNGVSVGNLVSVGEGTWNVVDVKRM